MQILSTLAAATAATCLLMTSPTDAHSRMMAMSMAKKTAYWDSLAAKGELPRTDVPSVRMARQSCPANGGSVSVGGTSYPCLAVDFLSSISLNDLKITSATSLAADIWGWQSPSGREISLLCVDNGVWFIDSTDAENPVRLGYLASDRPRYAWCDIKVYRDAAYIVKDASRESAPTNGIQVFDLTRLEALTGSGAPVALTADFVYREHGRSHNLAVDTESGFLYSVGTTTCSGGLHMIDLSVPLRPTFAGCVSGDGYTHDAQVVVYDGPDSRYTGRQIAFAYNEDTLTIWDVTTKASPVMISRTGYPTARYTHQGWLTQDMAYVYLNDELDEDEGAQSSTTTYIVDVRNLQSPRFVDTFDHGDRSPDHNLYMWGAIHAKGWGGSPAMANPMSSNFAYLSNYVAGIKVLDIENPLDTKLAGYFDVAPDKSGNTVFDGTWSNYMHPSGNLAVSSIDRGFFMLRFQRTFETAAPTPPTAAPAPTAAPPPTVQVTDAPTEAADCADLVPSGLTYSSTGLPAECVEIESYCDSTAIVRERCPETCGLCAAAGDCEDNVPSGLTWSNTGAEAFCSEFDSFYCSTYSQVREACPRTCGTCEARATSRKADVLSIKLPSFITAPAEREASIEEKGDSQSVLMIIVGVLGVACVSMAAALVVVLRKGKKAEAVKEMQTEEVSVPMPERKQVESNPMFEEA